MEQIRIRKYKSEDYFKVCEIDKPLFEGMGGHILFRHIEELFPSFFFVSEETGTNKIVGYLMGG